MLLLGVYLSLLSLFIVAGFWQLDRAEEKRNLLVRQSKAQEDQRLKLSDATGYHQGLRYAGVTLSGRYDQDHQFLIDNQVLNKRVGYFVMTPFLPEHQKISVLVNRGWVPANLDRTVLPKLPLQNTQSTITGRINDFPSVGIKLAGAEIPAAGWPSVVQLVDSKVLANKLEYPLHQFQVQLDNDMADGYQRFWESALMKIPPEKHTAYAMQWFSFALVLTLIFVVLTVKRELNESETKA